MTIAARRPEDMATPRGQGWGNYSRGRIHDADNPPEAPKVSSREALNKSRVGKDTMGLVFWCQRCNKRPADKQLPCRHILCQDCLDDWRGDGECPLCKP